MPGSRSRPQSLNSYTYVLNQPTRLTDPSGLLTEEQGGECGVIRLCGPGTAPTPVSEAEVPRITVTTEPETTAGRGLVRTADFFNRIETLESKDLVKLYQYGSGPSYRTRFATDTRYTTVQEVQNRLSLPKHNTGEYVRPVAVSRSNIESVGSVEPVPARGQLGGGVEYVVADPDLYVPLGPWVPVQPKLPITQAIPLLPAQT